VQTGRTVSLLTGISAYCEAATKVPGRSLGEVADAYLSSVAPATRVAVADLTKTHIDAFFETLDEFSPKTRNHYRASFRAFFAWSWRKDMLASTNRLSEANGLRSALANTSEILFYTPAEFGAVLNAAEGSMRAAVAILGLAVSEMLRLDRCSTWRTAGHIEVIAEIAKTRARRLVPICTSVAL
jgi:hypothetical protein